MVGGLICSPFSFVKAASLEFRIAGHTYHPPFYKYAGKNRAYYKRECRFDAEKQPLRLDSEGDLVFNPGLIISLDSRANFKISGSSWFTLIGYQRGCNYTHNAFLGIGWKYRWFLASSLSIDIELPVGVMWLNNWVGGCFRCKRREDYEADTPKENSRLSYFEYAAVLYKPPHTRYAFVSVAYPSLSIRKHFKRLTLGCNIATLLYNPHISIAIAFPFRVPRRL